MGIEKNIKTRIVLTHDEYSALSGKTLKEGEVVIAKVGTTEANGKVSEPIWMMKVGCKDEEGNLKTVANCPWLVAPAADVYEWAKKASLDANDLPEIPGDKLGITVTVTGEGNAITDASWDATTKTLTLTKGATFSVEGHTHDDKADKVTGAVAGNFAGLDENGNLVDSGKKADDFAVAGHNHDDDYKKIQTAVEETGAADKTLKISQDAQGVITAEAVAIAITHEQVTDFDAAVTGVVGDLGVTAENIEDLTNRLGAAEEDIVELGEAVATKVEQEAYNTKIAALEQADADEKTAREAVAERVGALETASTTYATKTELTDGLALKADKATYEEKVAELEKADTDNLKAAKDYVDEVKATILGENEKLVETYDTLSEIGQWIETSGVDATDLTTAIAAETKNREDADKAINDVLDTFGDVVTHNAADFATAEQGATADATAAKVATYGDIVTHNVAEFATAEQGTKADNAAAAIATYGDIVTHNASEFQAAGNYEAAGAADAALEAAKKYTDDEIAELDLANTYAAKEHEHSVEDLTDFERVDALDIDVETLSDNGYATAKATRGFINSVGSGLSGRITDLENSLHGLDVGVTKVSTTANNGLKVTPAEGTGEVNIEIDDTIVFVLDGGDASNLD